MPPPYAWSITSVALDEAGVDLPPKLGERDIPALEGRAQEAPIYRVIQENIPQLVNVLRIEQGVQREIRKGSERFVLRRWRTQGSTEKGDMNQTE